MLSMHFIIRKARSILRFAAFSCLAGASLPAQIVEFERTLGPSSNTFVAPQRGATFLNAAGVEAMNTAMQAATQVIRLDIGEFPFVLPPLFFYVGATGSAFGANGPRAAVASILNPLSGNFNVRSASSLTLKRWGTQSVVRLTYDVGGKQFTAIDTLGAGKTTFVGSGQAGFRVETKASLNKTDNGIAYFQAMGGALVTGSSGSFERLFGLGTRKYMGSVTIDAGIDIAQVLLARFSFYRALHPGVNAVLEKSIYKLGFDYHPN